MTSSPKSLYFYRLNATDVQSTKNPPLSTCSLQYSHQTLYQHAPEKNMPENRKVIACTIQTNVHTSLCRNSGVSDL